MRGDDGRHAVTSRVCPGDVIAGPTWTGEDTVGTGRQPFLVSFYAEEPRQARELTGWICDELLQVNREKACSGGADRRQ